MVRCLVDIDNLDIVENLTISQVFDPRFNTFANSRIAANSGKPDISIEQFLTFCKTLYSVENFKDDPTALFSCTNMNLVERMYRLFPDKVEYFSLLHFDTDFIYCCAPYKSSKYIDFRGVYLIGPDDNYSANSVSDDDLSKRFNGLVEMVDSTKEFNLANLTSSGANISAWLLIRMMTNKQYVSDGGRLSRVTDILGLTTEFKIIAECVFSYEYPEVALTYDFTKDRSPLYQVFSYSTNVIKYLGNYQTREKTKKGRSIKPSGPLYGVELELASDHDVKSLIDCQDTPFFICKQDSSISGSGRNFLECVTAPMDYRAQRIAWGRFFRNYYDQESGSYLGFDTSLDTTNGMHVHIDRKAFTEKHLKAFTWFISDILNREFILYISERGSSLGVYADMGGHGHLTRKQAFDNCVERAKRGRGGINIATRSGKTIEVRIFKGIVSYATLLKNLDFVDAVYYFTQEMPFSKLRPDEFIEWVNRQPPQRYKALKKYLSLMNSEILKRYQLGLVFSGCRRPQQALDLIDAKGLKISRTLLTFLNEKFKGKQMGKKTFIIRNGKFMLNPKATPRMSAHEKDFVFKDAA